MKKTVILTLLLFLSSCGSGTTVLETELQTGTDGLTIDILDFPTAITEEDKFYLALELRNEGFYDIEDARVFASVERDFVEVDNWDLPEDFTASFEGIVSFTLDGKSIYNTRGDKQILRAVMNTKKIDPTRNLMKSRIVINACYSYSTILSDTICIDTDPSGLSVAAKTCTSTNLNADSQGAPVAITKVDQKIIPGTSSENVGIEFTILAKNKGSGLIVNPDGFDIVCLEGAESREDYNTIKIKRIGFYDFELDSQQSDIVCTPNVLRETKDGYITKCRLNEGRNIPKKLFTFETPIVIELEYGYRISEGTEIEIMSKDPGFFG